MKTTPPNLSPIRIYVLWHPGFDGRDESKDRDPATPDDKVKIQLDRGLKLARRIYHWFRMENMEGIPVYFRSTPEKAGTLPPEIRSEAGVRNYIIPLVDAHMVSSPEWRRYVKALADKDDDRSTSRRKDSPEDGPEYRVLPVAMESVAYNMPDSMRKLNFIRHIPRDEKLPEDMELLAKLTEVLCRDLRYWIRHEAEKKRREDIGAPQTATIPGKIKIFLSHAKADDTEEAVAIKEYIQRETQCEAFFDETDIASAYDYATILEGAITGESAGLVVIQGDNYADRPWCRKEIRDFLNPVRDPLADGSGSRQFFISPVVVVQSMKGVQIGRTIPELGYSPCVRWKSDAPRLIVTTLLREILFGLFYRTLAKRIAELDGSGDENSRACVYINRAPDPVMVNRIMKQLDREPPKSEYSNPEIEIVHPGYGLSRMEMEGLESSARGMRFSSFLDRSAPCTPEDFSLAEQIIAISVGNPGDILSRGLGDEHIRELLVRILRPLLSRQASLLYSGAMPENLRPIFPWEERVNYTVALLQLLITERETKKPDLENPATGTEIPPPRIYVPRPWHERNTITPQEIAKWTDICSFIPMSAADSHIKPAALPPKPKPLGDDDFEGLNDKEKKELKKEQRRKDDAYAPIELALRAICLSAMRRKICDPDQPLLCELPDSPSSRELNILAHILIGGKINSFIGIMPGVFEEALCAFEAGKPLFIIPEGGGAAALLAKWLITFPKPKLIPPEFTVDFYRGNKLYDAILSELKNDAFSNVTASPPSDALGKLWKHIAKAKSVRSLGDLLKNGLTGEENERLLNFTSSLDTCELVWKGIKKLAPKPGPADAEVPA